MLRRARLGMAMFLLSEAVFFLFLIIAFVYFHTSESQILGVGFQAAASYTGCLLASSFAMWRAASNAKRNRIAAVRWWVGAAILLGVVFLVGQWREFVFGDPGRHLASAFLALMGCHELHAAVGILLLGGIFLFQAGEVRSVAVQTVALYWYFVAVVRLATFITVVWTLV